MPTDLTTIDTVEVDTEPATNKNEFEYSCEVCGKELVYGGRGRKPKYCDEHKKSSPRTPRATSARSTKDVDAAVTTLDQMYSLVAMALTMTQAHTAAQIMVKAADEQKQKNKELLALDPVLAKRIASLGQTGGRYAFFASQAMMMGPVIMTAYSELALRSRKNVDSEDDGEDIHPSMGGVPFG